VVGAAAVAASIDALHLGTADDVDMLKGRESSVRWLAQSNGPQSVCVVVVGHAFV
jgi:hypothetical protein